MFKNVILAIIAIFISWSVLDFIIHAVLLQNEYAATASLWRPMDEMKMELMYAVTGMVATLFVLIYAWLIRPKSIANGIRFGLFYGTATGLSMGYGSLSVMPITYKIALFWFGGTLIEALIAGLLVALIVKE